MTFDGILLYKVCLELAACKGQQLRQVYQTSKTNFYFKLSRSSIQLSLNPSFPFISAGKKETGDGKISSPILIFLRRHLTNLFLSEITQNGMDRQLTLKFTGSNPFGERIEYYLNLEIMGPNSNMIVTDSRGMIQQVFKSKITRLRTVATGVEYVKQENSGLRIDTMDEGEFFERLVKTGDKIDKSLSMVLQGFSRNTVRILLENAGVGVGKTVDLTDVERIAIWSSLEEIKDDLENPFLYVFFREGKTDLSAIKPEFCEELKMLEPSEGITTFMNSQRGESELTSLKKRVSRKLRNEIKRLDKLRDRLYGELREIEDYENYKTMGELIIANLYKYKEKMDKIEVDNWQTGESVEIDLDSRLTLSENAQLFFKYYSKAKRKQVQVNARIEELTGELNYLEQLFEMIELCENTLEIEALKPELISAGVIKVKATRRKKKTEKSGPRIFKYNGFLYYVGKSNTQNDEITKGASKEDFWFHARGIPGAHVILKTAGIEPGEDEILYGAALAARFSRGKMSSSVDIDYTRIASVWKPKGAKPGMVLYKKFNTVKAKPVDSIDEEVVD